MPSISHSERDSEESQNRVNQRFFTSLSFRSERLVKGNLVEWSSFFQNPAGIGLSQ